MTKTIYVCYDDFNRDIYSRHYSLRAAMRARDRVNKKLIGHGYSAIMCIMVLDGDTVRELTGAERVDLDICEWESDTR